MKNLQTFEEFLNESLTESNFKKGDKLIHDRSGEEVEFISNISPIKMTVKDKKGKSMIVSPMYYTLKESAVDVNLTEEQRHISVLMDYIITHVDEDDYDMFDSRIGRKLKKADWKYVDIEGSNLGDIKEMLKKYYIKEKLITDKLLKNPAKKWQDIIAAMKWLTA